MTEPQVDDEMEPSVSKGDKIVLFDQNGRDQARFMIVKRVGKKFMTLQQVGVVTVTSWGDPSQSHSTIEPDWEQEVDKHVRKGLVNTFYRRYSESQTYTHSSYW